MNKAMMILTMGLVVLLSGCMGENADYDPAAEYQGPINYNTFDIRSTYTAGSPNTTSDLGQTNEEYATFTENVFIHAESMSVSTFSIDVDTASYTNVRRMLFDNIWPNPYAVRIEEMINYFDYGLVAPTGDDVMSIHTELSRAPWNPDHQLLMVGLKTEDIEFDDAPANNLVFLLDVSGSMGQPNKLPLLKQAMKLLVDQIRPQDRISIVVYASATGLVLDGADGNDQEAIIEAIDNLSAGGSTAGAAGIQLAYQTAMNHFIEDGNNRVILGTDGDFNVGVSSDSALEELIVEKRESGVFLSVLGFGTGNLKDSKMETLADKGNGVYYYIDNLLEAKKVFVEELGGSLVTVAKDVKLQIEFNPANVKGYRLIGYENRLLDYDDFDDDTKDAGDMGAGHEVVALYEIIPASSDEVVDAFEFEQPEELKYDGTSFTEELMTLQIRYKDPENTMSELIEDVVYVAEETELPSEAFRFASAVAEFGMLLRDSEYKGESSYLTVIDRATAALGEDEHGYRSQFISLVQQARALIEED